MSWTWPLLGIAAGVAVLTVATKKAISAISPSAAGGDPSKSIATKLEKAASKFPAAAMAAARKWSATRGIPLREVLAVILLESRGDPKAHAHTPREDSYGLMQVNTNAHKSLMASKGYKVEDLYDPDKGVEVGTAIWKSSRDVVDALVASLKVKPAHDVGTLTRLRYAAGGGIIDPKLRGAKTTEDTVHMFKNSEEYVQHWRDAVSVVRKFWPEVA